jgi:Tol biopolymer transport system component
MTMVSRRWLRGLILLIAADPSTVHVARLEPAVRQVSVFTLRDYGHPSPDGRYLAFRDDDNRNKWVSIYRDLSILELSTGNVRRVVTHADPMQVGHTRGIAWSPDGARIAYPWCNYIDRSRWCELRVIGIDEQGARVLVPRSEITFEPLDWSPDGRHLLTFLRHGAAHEGGRLALVSVETGAVRQLQVSDIASGDAIIDMNARFSRDSGAVVYTKDRNQWDPYWATLGGEIFIVPIEDGAERPLIEHPADDRFVAWTPNGRSLLFTSDRSGTHDLWIVDFVNGVAVGQPSIIKRQTGLIGAAVMTPTGRLIYRNSDDPSSEVEVAFFDPASGRVTTNPEPIERDPARRRSSPAWSSSGQSLGYQSAPAKPRPYYHGDGEDTITVHTPEGGPRSFRLNRPCANDREHSWSMSWAPDRRSLLVSLEGSRARCRGLYTVDVQTAAVTPITQRRPLAFGTWLPDARSVVFVSELQDVIVRDVAAGTERTILKLSARPEYEHGRITAFALAPNGRSAALIIQSTNRQQQLAVMRIASGLTQEADALSEISVISGTNGWAAVAWTPDGRFLLFVENSDYQTPGQVWRVSAAGGRPEPIGLPVPAGDQFTSLSVRADGRAIAFERRHFGYPAKFFLLDNLLPARAALASPARPAVR